MRPALLIATRRPILAGSTALAALALGACGSGDAGTDTAATSGSGAASTISVESSDDSCTLSTTSAAPGTVTFSVRNTGSDITEFYVYGQGDAVVGEVEDIAPGLTKKLTVTLTSGTTYTAACKPGMTGDGIRTDVTVTG